MNWSRKEKELVLQSMILGKTREAIRQLIVPKIGSVFVIPRCRDEEQEIKRIDKRLEQLGYFDGEEEDGQIAIIILPQTDGDLSEEANYDWIFDPTLDRLIEVMN